MPSPPSGAGRGPAGLSRRAVTATPLPNSPSRCGGRCCTPWRPQPEQKSGNCESLTGRESQGQVERECVCRPRSPPSSLICAAVFGSSSRGISGWQGRLPQTALPILPSACPARKSSGELRCVASPAVTFQPGGLAVRRVENGKVAGGEDSAEAVAQSELPGRGQQLRVQTHCPSVRSDGECFCTTALLAVRPGQTPCSPIPPEIRASRIVSQLKLLSVAKAGRR